MAADSIGWYKERKSGRRLEEEGGPDWWTRGASDTQGETDASARASWANGAHWARPRRDAGKRETGRARGKWTRASGRLLGYTGRKLGREKKLLFFFPFQIFQSIFKWFWILFWIWIKPLNTKYSNATAWVHKHVPTLIFDFKLIKIIIILSLYTHKIA
jgi:hypothetical protein